MRKLFASLLLSGLLLQPALAAIDTYEFPTEAEQQRFRNLTEQLRCPKCQNQNIADSEAEISLDMRELTYQMMIKQGKSNEEIIEHMVARYGDFVRYKPAVDKRTLILWYGPYVVLAVALLSLLLFIGRRRKTVKKQGRNALSDDEQQRIEQLIEQTREKKE